MSTDWFLSIDDTADVEAKAEAFIGLGDDIAGTDQMDIATALDFWEGVASEALNHVAGLKEDLER